MNRPYALEHYITPYLLLLGGIASLIPFLLTQSLALRALQFCLLLLLACVCKRVKIWYFVFLALSIVFFGLLTPAGKSLFSFGNLVVTLPALVEGLQRAMTLLGFTFTSLWAVSSKLVVPGRFGRLFHASLVFYSRIFAVSSSSFTKAHDQKHSLRNSQSQISLVVRLDALIFGALESKLYQKTVHRAMGTIITAHCVFVFQIVLVWLIFLIQLQQ